MSRSSLLPREHGAYAEIAFPVATALVAGGPTVAAIAFAAAAVGWFFLHEPVAVLTGTRGRRLQVERASAARERIRRLGAFGLLAGAVGMVTASPAGRLAAMVPLGLALSLVPAVLRGRQKTLAAEIVVIAAFSATVLPVGIAGGVAWSFAWMVSGVWFVSFVLGTLAVHAIKAHHKQVTGAQWTRTGAPLLAAATIAAGTASAAWDVLPTLVGLAAVPPATVACAASVARVHPRRLKRVGWSLVLANAATLAMLLASPEGV